MNRSQGVTTTGILVLGVLLRTGVGGSAPAPQSLPTPAVPTAAASSDAPPAAPPLAKSAKKQSGAGPWIASCRYWETSSGLAYPKEEKKPAGASREGNDKDGKSKTTTGASAEESISECERNGDAWGFAVPPRAARKHTTEKVASLSRVTPHITAIIAAVPDPLHTHLALGFDRQIDAILQAAAENDYLVSQYWLPWKMPGTNAPADHPDLAADSGSQRRREEQPGLLVLKRSPKKFDWSAYDHVIYLFLVGESPAYGMNGPQLRNALRYESMLRNEEPTVQADLSMRGSADLAIIGSPHSGAAVSLREAIEATQITPKALNITSVHIAGSTDTSQANEALEDNFAGGTASVEYLSFGDNFKYEEDRTLDLLTNSGYNTDRVALLVEDGTVFGDTGKFAPDCYQGAAAETEDQKKNCDKKDKGPPPLIVRFPREISLLRNAQASDKSNSSPSPYLHLTLKDPDANDTVPHFSNEQTPLSQEASLMSIQRELVAYHAQFLVIQATNILDEIFLANYFHRACPNIRLLFLGGGDLLLEREVDNVPYIGSVSMTPYNLVGLMKIPPGGPASRAFPDSASEAAYNAASYIFQDQTSIAGRSSNPMLASYQTVTRQGADGPIAVSHASLWATVIGSDGYYPLGVVSSCASDSDQSLPDFVVGQHQKCVPMSRVPIHSTQQNTPAQIDEMQQFAGTAHLFPSLTWTVVSVVLGLYCLGHGMVVLVADFWSPFTRDVAISHNDQPARRSVYMNIGTVMLFSMVFVLEWPVFHIGPVLTVNPASANLALAIFSCGLFAVAATFLKTWPYSFRLPESKSEVEQGSKPAPEVTSTLTSRLKLKVKGRANSNYYQVVCLFFNLSAVATLFAIPLAWRHICSLDSFGDLHTNYGVFFSYRCLHPDSEVSPAVPILLILLAWYLWAYCQTFRLRFSKAGRPRLPGPVESPSPLPLYVDDDSLADCTKPRSASLYTNITCLLITRELLVRFVHNPRLKTVVSVFLAAAYVVFFGGLMHFKSIESVDRMVLDPGRRPTCYEALLVALTGPLLFIGLTGWLRMMLVWGSLRRGLLERLEMYPMRRAFTRLKGVGWMAMMRDTGLHTRWKDMARSNESIRQLINDDEIVVATASLNPQTEVSLQRKYSQLEHHLKEAFAEAGGRPIAPHSERPSLQRPDPFDAKDLPNEHDIDGLELIAAIETDYAAVGETLLHAVLIPYWLKQRIGFVEGEDLGSAPIHARRKSDSDQPHDPIELHAASASGDPEYIRLAEEFLALRYLSLIRAVLGNIRYLMTFISAVFVLSLVAWNSYPFQPRELIDWAFTLAFLVLGGGIIWVFAQMHRNALLNRITDTTPNELGFDFYWRIVTFGAVPVLTWLSYQFPQAWSGIFRIVQPGLSAMK